MVSVVWDMPGPCSVTWPATPMQRDTSPKGCKAMVVQRDVVGSCCTSHMQTHMQCRECTGIRFTCCYSSDGMFPRCAMLTCSPALLARTALLCHAV